MKKQVDDSVRYNPHNNVIQSHRDGTIYEPVKDNSLTITSVEEIKLPPFLYKDSMGTVFIGYDGDTDVTEEWNNWIKENLTK